MLICGQFIAKDVNLWSTFLFVRFEKFNLSDFWGPLNFLRPSKKTQLLDSWPLSMPQKSRPWVRLVWKKCPVSTALALIMGLVTANCFLQILPRPHSISKPPQLFSTKRPKSLLKVLYEGVLFLINTLK